MYATLALLITFGAGFFGHWAAKRFVGTRLRFVDAIRSPWAPWIVGIASAVVASPLALLPLFGSITAVAFGVGAGLGTASGVRAIARGKVGQRRLVP